MIQSMTAFARTQQQIASFQFCWEIRSVNHRYLDVSFRLPEPLRFLEPDLRMALKDTIHRGKVECQLRYQDTSTDNQAMLINMGMVNSLVELSNSLSSSHQLANDLGVSQLLAWPGIIQVGEAKVDKLTKEIMTLFGETIHQLSWARIVEGKALQACIQEKLHGLKQEVIHARSMIKDQGLLMKEKVLARLDNLQMNSMETRVEQEIAIMLTKLDAEEELERLQMHIEEVNRTLEQDKVAGRRLDFLMQELNREANTLSSKSVLPGLSQSAVEMKVYIEQMREQIQNIE